MTEEQDKSIERQIASDHHEPMAGERLGQARREQQISVLDVAKELHLDEPKVRALERNDFDVLGAPVFAKGHLRKYAQLVGVSEDDLFADYYAMTRTSSMPPLIVGRKKVGREFSPGPWIAIVVVVIVAAAAYWWFVVRESASPDPAPQSSVESDAPVVLAVALPGDEPSITEEPTVSEPVQQLLPDGHMNLSVSFSGDCWTEISDADGRSLFVELARSGKTVQLTGKAPMSVLFGAVDNVSVQVNGGNYSLPSPASADRRVRLIIPSP